MAVEITTEARRHGENHSGTTAKELEVLGDRKRKIILPLGLKRNPSVEEVVEVVLGLHEHLVATEGEEFSLQGRVILSHRHRSISIP